MKTKMVILYVVLAIVIIITALAIYMYPSYKFFFHRETITIDNNLYILRGGGGNSCLLVTDSAVVVIDTKMGKSADELYKLARDKAGRKPLIVINTHYHGDHVNGNNLYKGSKIFIGNYSKEFLQNNMKPENMPTDIVRDSLLLNLGNETVMLFNLGQAHTYNDLLIYLKNRKLLFTGDLVFNRVNPVLMKKSGANVDKWISVLNTILTRWDIVILVPGHGPLGGKELAASLKQYFEDMKVAASDPLKEKELINKYKDWTTMPSMASPDKTIEYIKESN